MNYFLPPNLVCQRNIEILINDIVHLLRNNLNHQLISIFLFGSFTQGEGVWKVQKGKEHIVSDLDIIVITKWQQNLVYLQQLRDFVLERHVSVDIDFRLIPVIKLPLYRKDLDTFELSRRSILIYGKNPLRLLPRMQVSDLNHKDIFFSFFNEVILSIERFSPYIVYGSDEENLEKLSHRAAKTMITSMNMICMHGGCYFDSISDRVAHVNLRHLASFPFSGSSFLNDLKTAYEFRFEHTNSLYIKDVLLYWGRAQSYIIDIFTTFLKIYYGAQDISQYPRLAHNDYSCRERLHHLYKSAWSYKLLHKLGYGPLNIMADDVIYCRMAALMLYLAFQHPFDLSNIECAQGYLSQIFPIKSDNRDEVEVEWRRLRDELVKLHKLGIY